MHYISSLSVGAALFAFSSIGHAAVVLAARSAKATGVCAEPTYSQYLSLTNNYLALDYCTSAYPAPVSVKTETSSVTTTKTVLGDAGITVVTTVTAGTPAVKTVTTTMYIREFSFGVCKTLTPSKCPGCNQDNKNYHFDLDHLLTDRRYQQTHRAAGGRCRANP